MDRRTTARRGVSRLTKRCNKCARELDASAFAVRRASIDRLAYKCRECDKAYRSKRPEHYVKLRRATYLKNRETEKQAALEYYRNNRELCMAKHVAYMFDTYKQQKQYRKINQAEYILRSAKRKAALLNRTPLWLTAQDYADMRLIYEACVMLTRLTGVLHHVDHTIPLQGKNVSGLHTPQNLQILTASENLSKNNRWATQL